MSNAHLEYHTERLHLRPLDPDAPADRTFILELLNQQSFIQHIGDRGVRTLDDAACYLREGPVRSYVSHGFGLLRMGLRDGGEAVGICGLLQRDFLAAPDLGYALLDRFNRFGYAYEAALATLQHAWYACGLKQVLAITATDNAGSIRLLEKLGMRLQRTAILRDDDTPSHVFGIDRPATTSAQH